MVMCELDDDMLAMLQDRIEHKVIDILQSNEKYLNIVKEINSIIDENHKLLCFFDQTDEITISKEEHEILDHYFALTSQREEMERMTFYFCGHSDCMQYKNILEAVKD